jgi:peptidoglycan-N-acetylglucosamine deacetylase
MLAALALALALAGCGAASTESTPPGPADADSPSTQTDAGTAEGDRKKSAGPPPDVRPHPLDHGPRDRRRVALTFDADMTPAMLAGVRAGEPGPYDRRIVRLLESQDVPATIFITGLWAKQYPDAVRAFARGKLFEVANHTQDHSAWTPDCYGLPAVATRREKRLQVTRAARRLEQLSGESPLWFRFPGLCHLPTDTRLVASLGEQPVDGDVTSGDAFQSDPAVVAQTVIDEVRPGSIVILHLTGGPTAPATAAALETIVPELRGRGYEFVTLGELMGAD